MSDPERCMGCKFFRPSHAYSDYGEMTLQASCARYPPANYTTQSSSPRDVYNRSGYASDPISTSVHSGQPSASHQGWCGEFKRDPKMPDRVCLLLVGAWVDFRNSNWKRFDGDIYNEEGL